MVWLGIGSLFDLSCSVEPRSDVSLGELSEASTNLEVEGVAPLLQRVARLVEGLSRSEVQSLAREIAALPIEAEREWNFKVRYRGGDVALRVVAFMDDVDAPDLAFFTTAELAAAIQREMRAYSQERGD
jgi:hypothetical protein